MSKKDKQVLDVADLLFGDCVEQMKLLPENSVDAVITDPPYELGFMGKSWDASGIAYSVEMWKEVLRVTKPGGHLLAFGGTRTYHRMACAIEDAGFEIRDQLQWLYGSGFPKSYNIGKGVDKLQGNEREELGENPNVRKNHDGHIYELGLKQGGLTKGCSVWEGWGSGLKPMNEPICLARKPLSEKNLVENVLVWGVGGLNIDASRIGTDQRTYKGMSDSYNAGVFRDDNWKPKEIENTVNGRFPGNVLLDEESAKMLDEQSGIRVSGARSSKHIIGNENGEMFNHGIYGKYKAKSFEDVPKSSGGASRFFYVAKASKSERNKGLENFEKKVYSDRNPELASANMPQNRSGNAKANHHPTVKPVKLMEYLVRLVTPKGGVVLDPFMGSGTTGIACRNLGFGFIGIEKEKEYFEIAKARIENSKELGGETK